MTRHRHAKATGHSEWESLELAASALAQNPDALEECVRSPDSLCDQADLWPALARRLADHGFEVPEAWREALRSSTAAWMRQEATHAALREALSEVVWLPIKGLYTATAAHRCREDRPMSDLDILVSPQNLPVVRARLGGLSWKSLWNGVRSERYLQEEGYAWSAESPQGDLLEVHFRLWSLLPERTVELILADRIESEDGGWTIDRAWAFILAAVHAWLGHRPRSLLDWWDVHLLARAKPDHLDDEQFIALVTTRAKDLGIGLPVLLSTHVVARCWPGDEVQKRLRDRLMTTLRGREAALLRTLEQRGPSAVRLSSIVGRRLLAGRETRAGARTALRRVWAHPGVVERQVEGGPFWWRRLRHLGRRALSSTPLSPTRPSAASHRVSSKGQPKPRAGTEPATEGGTS